MPGAGKVIQLRHHLTSALQAISLKLLALSCSHTPTPLEACSLKLETKEKWN